MSAMSYTTSPEDLDRLYAVNVRGVYHCLHFGIEKWSPAAEAVVLNMASIASKVGIADRFAYSMTKGAVLSMTLSVARDFVDKKIRCNCICPGPRPHTVCRWLSGQDLSRQGSGNVRQACRWPTHRPHGNSR
jgi:NAD(P)-dependent dehydrogenase (short-subunit alcohol dehydrogenase family)